MTRASLFPAAILCCCREGALTLGLGGAEAFQPLGYDGVGLGHDAVNQLFAVGMS